MGLGCSARHRSLTELAVGFTWGPVLPPPLCPGRLASLENSPRPAPSTQERGRSPTRRGWRERPDCPSGLSVRPVCRQREQSSHQLGTSGKRPPVSRSHRSAQGSPSHPGLRIWWRKWDVHLSIWEPQTTPEPEDVQDPGAMQPVRSGLCRGWPLCWGQGRGGQEFSGVRDSRPRP